MVTGKTTGQIIDQLRQKYGLGKSTVYARLNFLEISVTRSGGNCSLSDYEVDILDQLDRHIRDGGTMETFDRPLPLATYEDSAGIDLAAEGLEFGEVGADPMQRLVRSAQEQAAGVLIAQSLLAQQFKDNPEALDPDLLAQVEAARAEIAPKSQDPKAIALRFVNQYRSQQQTPTEARAIEVAA